MPQRQACCSPSAFSVVNELLADGDPLARAPRPTADVRLRSLLAVPILTVFAALEPSDIVAIPTVDELAALAWLAVIVTAVAFVFWYSGLARLGAERASLFLGLVPVGALATSLAVGVAQPRLWSVIGCLVCACGITVGAAAR